MRTDHDLPLKIVIIAKQEGCRTMILISAMGSNKKFNIFYSRVKSLLEISLDEIGFEKFHILSLGLLLGKKLSLDLLSIFTNL